MQISRDASDLTVPRKRQKCLRDRVSERCDGIVVRVALTTDDDFFLSFWLHFVNRMCRPHRRAIIACLSLFRLAANICGACWTRKRKTNTKQFTYQTPMEKMTIFWKPVSVVRIHFICWQTHRARIHDNYVLMMMVMLADLIVLGANERMHVVTQWQR